MEEKRLRTAIRIQPRHEMGYLRLAQFLEERRRYQETMSVLHEGQRNVPESILMIRFEGSLFQTLADEERVRIFYDLQLKQHPDAALLLLDRARWHWHRNRPKAALADLDRVNALNHESFEAHYIAGLIHLRSRDDEKALNELVTASKFQDGHAEVWSHIANLWHRQGDSYKARAAIRKALELEPESYPYLQQYVTYLEAALESNDLKVLAELRAAMRQLVWLESEDSWVLAHSGYLAWHEGDLDHAEAQLKRALDVQTNYPWARFRLGSVHMSRKQWQAAINSFEKGLKARPDSLWTLRQLGLAYEMQGNTIEAILRYESVLQQDADNLPLLLRLVNLYWQEFRFNDLERVLKQGMKKQPNNLELANLLLKYHQSRRQFDQAVTLLEPLAKRNPRNPFILDRMGQLEQERGKLEIARGWFRKALDADPEQLNTRLQLIQINLRLKQDEYAEPQLNDLLKQNPESEWALAQLARLKMRKSDYSEAQNLVEHGLSLHPGSIRLLKVEGLLHHQRRAWQDALYTFKKIDNLQPGNSLILTHLGLLRQINGNQEKARQQIGEALKARDSNLWAYFLHILYGPETEAAAWWGPDYERLHPIIEDLLHRQYESGWKGIKAARVDPLTRQALKNLYFVLQDFGERMVLNPEDADARTLPPWIRYLWGHLYEARGESNKALTHYHSVLEDVPDDLWLHTRVGVMFERTKANEQAVKHYQLFLDAHPDVFWVLFRLSMVCMNLGREAEAVALYRRMLQLRPDHALSLNNLAWLYLTSKDRSLRNVEEALELARRAVKAQASIDNVDTLAEAYFQSGDPERAIETLRNGARQAIYPKSRERYLELQYKRFREGNPKTDPPPAS